MPDKPVYKTTVVANLTKEKQWEVTINYNELPLSGREKATLGRAILVAAKNSLREFNLKQRALKRDAEATRAKVQAILTGNATKGTV